MTNQEKWDRRFIDLAWLVAGWSKDPSTVVGAVIVRPDLTIVSTGFNGFPRGCSDADELYANREEKYARVVHAEMNAILSANEQLSGCTMYTSWIGNGPSCDRCSAHIIQAGIVRVVCTNGPAEERWAESINRGLQMYEESGVEVVKLDVN